MAALAAALAGCSPALDWREVRPEGWALQALLPCRPGTQQRTVALAGAPVELVMVACAARDHTFALASAAVADPSAVGPALQALGAAARANVAGQVLEEGPVSVPGMTPQAAARHWRIQGRLPDGQPVVEDVLVFAHGLRVVQATVVGPSSGADLVRPFVEALRITP